MFPRHAARAHTFPIRFATPRAAGSTARRTWVLAEV